ncbi:Uncharacterized protein TCM_011159 [Theobroma cacao]|uniref:Uncharacterized protein n=1 Tax=Theobroma cacao TaxID=3641 RepID=A0A061EG21_THECC|nr:Uncharacterized protein TCM_011159 [Theobroma cacao]
MPVLEHVVNLKTEVDLENVLQRFDYDHICLLALGFDPKTLSAEFSNVPSKVAFDEVDEALLYRNILPVSIWKLQRWLQIGEEKKLSKGLKIVDDFVYNCISSKREKLSSKTRVEDDEFDLLTAFIVEEKGEMSVLKGKTAIKSDVLPSGDDVDEGARIFISVYSMGRMEEIWGKDCLEFKPERWISEHGDLVQWQLTYFGIIKLKWWRAKLAAQAVTLSGFTLKMV